MKRDYAWKAFLTVVLFATILYKINVNEALNLIIHLNPIYLLFSMSLIPLLYVIRTYRWGILLTSLGVSQSFNTLLNALLIGVFFGLLTPGKFGELGRAYYVNEKKPIVLSTILVEKLIDVSILVLLSLITIFIYFYRYTEFTYTIIAISIIVFLGAYLLLDRRILSLVAKPLKIAREDADNYVSCYSHLCNDKNTIILGAALAIIYYIINYIIAILTLESLGTDPALSITLPIIILIGNMPITISGLGIRESVGAACFMLLGKSAALGVSFSLMLFLTITVLPGIYGYILHLVFDMEKTS